MTHADQLPSSDALLNGVLLIDSFNGFTLAILLFFIGKSLSSRIGVLHRYGIPEPVVGGVLCAAVVCAVYYGTGVAVEFDLAARDTLLLYFFTALGLNTDVRTLKQGGRALIILSVLSIGFMVLQNIVGMLMAGAFAMDPRAGLMVGSVSLTGGVGTTLAWMHHFQDTLGIANAGELGLSANMVGLVAACVIGGPIANVLMRRHHVRPSEDAGLKVGTLYRDEPFVQLDYHGVLLALLWLNVAMLLGRGINSLVAQTPIHLPGFVGCLLAGIILRAVDEFVLPTGKGAPWRWPSMAPGLALISDICLGLFLTMALMGMQLWELAPMLGFITLTVSVQIALAITFTMLVVFRAMGRNYEAVVICSGFGGIVLGSTATAVANMNAITREFGAARQAFIVVPLVCGFVIDLANALVIGWLAR